MTADYYYYRVAGLTFAVASAAVPDPQASLPSFAPFVCNGPHEGSPCIFRLEKASEQHFAYERETSLESLHTAIGQMSLFICRGGYLIEVLAASGQLHRMYVDGSFSRAESLICWDDPFAGRVLGSMIRVVFSQAALAHDAFLLHAAVVVSHGRSYIFMGKSGTGKSTHARLWLRNFPGASLLNDDNPAVRIVGGVPVAFGTPWSGKTPCYKNEQYPVGGIVRLEQAKENRFIPRNDVEAFVTLLPGCAAFPGNAVFHGLLCDTIVRVISLVTTGTLQCLPDDAAARLCARSLGADTYSQEK